MILVYLQKKKWRGSRIIMRIWLASLLKMSRSCMQIIPDIVSYGSTCRSTECNSFLMKDNCFTQRDFHQEYHMIIKFMHAVFQKWLNSDDKTTLTWKTLCDCFEKNFLVYQWVLLLRLETTEIPVLFSLCL